MGRHSEGNFAVGKPWLGACFYCSWWARNWLETTSGLASSEEVVTAVPVRNIFKFAS